MMQERLTTKQGGASEFLNGGKLFDATGAVTDMMSVAEATSDPIESFFGTHDRVSTVQSKNTSFHVTGMLATWNHNRVSSFLKTLLQSQRDSLLRAAIWHGKGKRLKSETDASIAEAAAHKLQRLEQDAERTRKADKRVIHTLINLRSEKLFKTVDEYDVFKHSVNDDDKKIVKELKKQIRLLHHVCVCV